MAKLYSSDSSPRKPKRRVTSHLYSEEEEDDFFSLHLFDKVRVQTTRGKLLERFYEWNNTLDGMKPWIKMILDPPEYTPPQIHNWWIVHFKAYHTQIEINPHSPNRAHRCRLFYQQEAGSTLWLASAQVGPVYFYSQPSVAVEYMMILANRQFHMTEKESTKVVDR